jgi:hypothetical protein
MRRREPSKAAVWVREHFDHIALACVGLGYLALWIHDIVTHYF